MQKKKPSCTIDGNVSWCSHYGKQDESPQKIKIELPYDLAILLVSIYLKKMKILIIKDISTSMFTTA